MATSRSRQPRWIVTLADSARPADVVQRLVAAGFVVEAVHEAIGSVVGRASPPVARAIRDLPGVVDVAPDTPIDLGDPGRDTW